MENVRQGNESNAHVIILDQDGETLFNGRRTVREIENDGQTKTGKVFVEGETYCVFHENWIWTGSST